MSFVARAFSLAVSALAAVALECAPVQPSQTAASAPGKHYVCTACGSSCDLKVYDHPGTCPHCGMPLVEQGSAAAEGHKGKPVGILLFEGAEIIDFTGPWEVFGAAGFDVYTVAASKGPITTAMGMTVVPSYAFADAPQPAVLVVPGGGVKEAQRDRATLDWLVKTSRGAEQTLTVCNGAFIAASAGLLDGLSATTTFHLLTQMRTEFPKVTVVSDRRFVDNGKIVTAAGLSSGIDGALHVVDKMLGRGAAQKAALGIEYDWHPEGTFVRARLADHLIPEIDLDGEWKVERTEGTTDRWEIAVRGASAKSKEELLGVIDKAVAAKGRWERVEGAAGAARAWRFADEEGKPWTGALAIEGDKREMVMRLGIARVK